MVDCPFRDVRRGSRHGIRYVEQVCLIGDKGPTMIGSTEDEANTRFCNKCEVPTIMNGKHCKYLMPENFFALGGHFRTSYLCRYWNESLGNSENALRKCKICKDYSPV